MNSVSLVIAVLLGVMLVTVAKPILVYASIPGDFGAGYNAGQQAALSTFNSAGQRDASCSATGVSYCIGYHLGYGSEWDSLKNANYNTGGP